MKQTLLWKLWTSPLLQRAAGPLALTTILPLFLGDLLVPLGFSYGFLNALPILLAFFTRQPRWIVAVTVMAVSSTLLVPMLTTPPQGVTWNQVLFNRIVSAAACLLTGLLAVQVLTLVTKVREVNQDLRQSGELLEIASRIGKLGGWHVDLIRQTVYWSDEVARIHGRPPGYHPSFEEGFNYYPAEFRQQLLHAFEQCASEGRDFDIDLQIVTYHGQRRWVRVVGQALYDPRQRIVAVHGAFQDIQTEMNSRQEIIRSAERWHALAEAMPLIVWTADDEGHADFFSRQLEDYLQVPLAELLGDGWLMYLHPDDAPEVAAIWATHLRSHAPYEAEFRIRRHDGVYEWHLARANFVQEANTRGKWYGSALNIDEKRRLSEHMQQVQKLEALGQLTGGVAHDFNNLLTVIMGNAESLQEQLESQPRLERLAAMITGAAGRAADMTQRLLAFARKQALEPAPADLNRLLTGLEPLLQRTLGANIEIELIKSAALWTTLVDPGQLESCVLNLAINARDAMPQGGKLTLETANVHLDAGYTAAHPDLTPGQYVQLAVSDTGCGIAPELLKKVFEPFFTTKETGKGTGLGLAVVYGFVKQSNGHISVYSEPGAGTTIKIYLPRLRQGAASVPEPGEPELQPPGAGELILLVEDDALVQQYTHSQLLELGYRVLTASDARQALELLQAHPEIDLLFTDIMMPGGMNGDELAREAQRLRPELPVLYTTGYAENALIHHGRLDPGLLLLSKPYRRSELADKLRQALAQRA